MKFLAFGLLTLLLVASAIASDEWYGGAKIYHEEPKIIKIIKPVHVVKVIKHIPPPVPVIKYIKLYHSTHVGHPISYGHHSYGHHGW